MIVYGLLVAFLLSILLCGALVPLLKAVAKEFNVFDLPKQVHKTHVGPIPYLGGVGVALTFVILIFSVWVSLGSDYLFLLSALTILIPALCLCVVGLIDDLLHLSAIIKFVFQLSFGALLVIGLYRQGQSVQLFGDWRVDSAITILWILVVTNSMNFIDNHDGIASVVTIITCAAVFVISNQSGSEILKYATVILAGTMIGFLVWNFPPASIYLGDAGSLFLGITLSILAIKLNIQTSGLSASIFIPFFLLGVPLLDFSVAISSRIRDKRPLTLGAKDHLAHRLSAKGLSKRSILFLLGFLQLISCSLAVSISIFDTQNLEFIILFGALTFILLYVYFLSRSEHV